MGNIFRSDEEYETVRMHASQNDALALAVLRPRPERDAREALHQWRRHNRVLFRKIIDSWRSQKLLERIVKARGVPAYYAT